LKSAPIADSTKSENCFVELHARIYLEKSCINFTFADTMRGATGVIDATPVQLVA
jgi:hypothetical protein